MLDIVIPVYNEEKNIECLLNNIRDKVSLPKTVYIIYDNDSDSTVSVVLNIKDHFDFKVHLQKNLFGSGALNAIKTGFKITSSDIILIVMGDLSDNLEIVNQMYKIIAADGFDIVCGSRYMVGGKQIGGHLLKKTFSKVAGVSLHYLIGIPTHDVTNNFKMYRRNVIDQIKIESNSGFEIGMEITIKTYLNGFRITEIPTTWKDRSSGKSRFKMWRWLPHYIRWYVWAISKWWGNKITFFKSQKPGQPF